LFEILYNKKDLWKGTGLKMEKVTLTNGFRILLEPVDWARSATDRKSVV